MKSAPHQ